MRKIKVFIGSSIDDLAYERRDLVSFIAELNNKYIDRGIYIEPYICEEKSNEMRPEGSQKIHDKYIEDDADAMVFMFFKKAGKYTLRELQIAKDTLASKDKKSHVFIYFKTENNAVADTTEIKEAIDKIAGEYAHYYKRFSESDTIKLELLQYLTEVLGEESLSICDGKIYLGNIVANDLVLSNVFAYQNNQELTNLKKELRHLTAQLHSCVENENWSMYDSLSSEIKEKQIKCNDLETNIFKMLQQCYKSLHKKEPSENHIKAFKLLEVGKYHEALLRFPIDVIKTKASSLIEKKRLQEEILKHEADELIEDAMFRIYALMLDDNNAKLESELDQTYDSVAEIALIAGNSKILIDYADFLIDTGNIIKALSVVKKIESNFDVFDDIDLYTKYDMYNLLAELCDEEKEQNHFCSMAKDSLFTYIRGLDKKEWKTYVDACDKLSELLVDEDELLPFLTEAVEILEMHPEESNQEQILHNFYNTIGLLYKESSNTDYAEKYFCKAADIVVKKISNMGNIVDVFLNKIEAIKDKKVNNYKIPWDILLCQSNLVRIYEHLYELNAKQYEVSLVEQLSTYAMLLFVNDKYRQSVDELYKAAKVSGENEQYVFLREFVEKLKQTLK